MVLLLGKYESIRGAMRVLICGSRDWKDEAIIDTIVHGLVSDYSELDLDGLVIIHGGAPGADSMAGTAGGMFREFGKRVKVDRFPADWKTFGNAAGPIRNQQMLDEGKPEMVIAFTNDLSSSKGTKDMVRRAKQAGLPTYIIGRA